MERNMMPAACSAVSLFIGEAVNRETQSGRTLNRTDFTVHFDVSFPKYEIPPRPDTVSEIQFHPRCTHHDQALPIPTKPRRRHRPFFSLNKNNSTFGATVIIHFVDTQFFFII
jgi:hypothetical protein